MPFLSSLFIIVKSVRASFYIGETLGRNEILKDFGDRIIVLDDEKWFVPKFIDFQYGGELSNDCKTHGDAIRILKELRDKGMKNNFVIKNKKIVNEVKHTLTQQLPNSLERVSVSVSDTVSKSMNNNIYIWFEDFWSKYPKKVGKEVCQQIFIEQIVTEEAYDNINTALTNYLNCDEVKRGFIKNARNWFGEWKDWIVYKDPIKTDNSHRELDILLESRLGKVAGKESIKKLLRETDPNKWGVVKKFLSNKYKDGQSAYYAAEKELATEKREVPDNKVSELTKNIGKV